VICHKCPHVTDACTSHVRGCLLAILFPGEHLLPIFGVCHFVGFQCGRMPALSGALAYPTHPSDLIAAALPWASIVEAVPIVEADWPNRN